MAQHTEKKAGEEQGQKTASLPSKEKEEEMVATHGDVLLEDDDFEEFEEDRKFLEPTIGFGKRAYAGSILASFSNAKRVPGDAEPVSSSAYGLYALGS